MPVVAGLAPVLISLTTVVVVVVALAGLSGRRERDRFITDLEQVRAEALADRGEYKSTR